MFSYAFTKLYFDMPRLGYKVLKELKELLVGFVNMTIQ